MCFGVVFLFWVFWRLYLLFVVFCFGCLGVFIWFCVFGGLLFLFDGLVKCHLFGFQETAVFIVTGVEVKGS